MEDDGAVVQRLGRQTVDLLTVSASEDLSAQLQPNDALVVISALAPCKNTTMLAENIQMMDSVCRALQSRPVDHVVYISSDAVYADSLEPLTEGSIVQPDSLHGMMHAAREVMLRDVLDETPFAVLRPSLLYGATDPHNGYGPNQFRRRVFAGDEILLFGEGEERRDHVLIDDVAEIVRLVLLHRSEGTLNIATGIVTSFKEVAEMVVRQFDPAPLIGSRPRVGPMPHNGYRPFGIEACHAAFPAFSYTPLSDGIALCHAAERSGSHGHR
jgi:nucleoside-diphosphate-sugar epimerase